MCFHSQPLVSQVVWTTTDIKGIVSDAQARGEIQGDIVRIERHDNTVLIWSEVVTNIRRSMYIIDLTNPARTATRIA